MTECVPVQDVGGRRETNPAKTNTINQNFTPTMGADFAATHYVIY